MVRLQLQNSRWNTQLVAVSFPLVPINPSTCIRTGFADVVGPQNHDLHRLVGHTVHQGVLRDGHQQKVARAAAGHGSWRRVARQPHGLCWEPSREPFRGDSGISSSVPARRASRNLLEPPSALLWSFSDPCPLRPRFKVPQSPPGSPPGLTSAPGDRRYFTRKVYPCNSRDRESCRRSRCVCAGRVGGRVKTIPYLLPRDHPLPHPSCGERNRMRQKMFFITSLLWPPSFLL